MDLAILIIGIGLIIWPMFTTASGFVLKLFFKVIPTVSGMYLIFYYLMVKGMILGIRFVKGLT